jgi:hypothetical protein
MSNHLAIAAVTATLKRTLQAALNVDVPGATVSMTRPPPASDDSPQSVNIYLYQVTPNPSLRGVDLPTRRDGQVVNRPVTALNLHYIFSFYGDETTLEPQAALGSVVRALHSQPVLTADTIAQTLADPTFSFVAASDLGLTPEPVRFTPTGLTFEEFSKLWSVLFQIPYVLSVTYEGSVVLLDQALPMRVAPPVRTTRLSVDVAGKPVLTSILSRAAAATTFESGRPIGAGDTLLLRGRSLQAHRTRVAFADAEVDPAAVSPTEITVPLPATLRAGAQPVAAALLPSDRALAEVFSDPLVFLLRPRIVTTAVAATAIDAQVTPRVGKRQRAVLLLKETPSPADRPPRGFTIDRVPPAPAAPADTDTLSFPRAGVAAGTYLASVRVDGADSPLEFDPATDRYTGPTLVIP